MAIGAINGMSNGYYQTPIRPVKRVELENIRENERAEKQKQQSEGIQVQEVQKSSAYQLNPAPKAADLENISLQFNNGETYEYIGKDKPIENLDVKQALSEMQKDQLLEEYHYFVGNERSTGEIFKSGDGKVVIK